MIKAFTVGKHIFSSQEHVLIIAEIGTGHNGSLQKAKELVAAAKESGADAGKFTKPVSGCKISSAYTI